MAILEGYDDQTVIIGAVSVLLATLLVFFLFGKSSDPVALSDKEYRAFTLVDKKVLSHNTRRFRFALQSDRHVLGLPIGQHVSLMYYEKADTPVMRPYTPTSFDAKGYVDFVIKVYENSKMGSYLDSLEVGSGTVNMKGPKGSMTYFGNGIVGIRKKDKATKKFVVQKKRYSKIGMVAGGTGITPAYQTLQALLAGRDKGDTTEVSLIYANQTEDDILLRAELDEMAAQDPKLHLHYTLDRPPAGWAYDKGFVTADMIKEHLPPPADDTILLVCGPKPMVKYACEDNFKALGYDMENSYFAW